MKKQEILKIIEKLNDKDTPIKEFRVSFISMLGLLEEEKERDPEKYLIFIQGLNKNMKNIIVKAKELNKIIKVEKLKKIIKNST